MNENDLIYTFKTAFRVTGHEKSILILSSYVENNEKSTFPTRKYVTSYSGDNKSKGDASVISVKYVFFVTRRLSFVFKNKMHYCRSQF